MLSFLITIYALAIAQSSVISYIADSMQTEDAFGQIVDIAAARVLGASTVRQFPEAQIVSPAPFTATAFPIRIPDAPNLPQRIESDKKFYLNDAHAAVVIDVDSGKILYDQSAHDRRAIASLTKLYTAYVVRTSGVAMDAPVTVHEDSLNVIGSRVGCKSSVVCEGTRLVVGETLTVRDLLTAMLVSSANDAAAVLAQYIAGSEKAFVDLMNIRAEELGLTDSHFCTPSGLEPEGELCYSSAADIGRIAALAVHDGLIWKLLNTKEASITSIDGTITHKLVATNQFAQTDDVPGMIGAKTGFTPQAGKSLLMAVQHPLRKGPRIVAVTLGDPWRWRDIKALVEWTWETYEW